MSPSPTNKKRQLKSNIGTENPDGWIAKLRKYAQPAIKETRYCLYQKLVTLIEIDDNSPIYKSKLKPIADALVWGGNSIVNYHTLRRYICNYRNNLVLPTEGEEGTRQGKPPMVSQSRLLQLNDRVLNNIGKVDTMKDLSEDIISSIGDQQQAKVFLQLARQ